MAESTFHKLCLSCNKNFEYKRSDTFIDDNGYGYSTKLVKCKCCGRINILQYFEDKSMKLNNDRKYYDYDMIGD